MMHCWTRAILTAVMLSTLTGCSSRTATPLLSSVNTYGLRKTEIQERFGTPTSSGVTSAGRQTNVYRIQKEERRRPFFVPDRDFIGVCLQLFFICVPTLLLASAIPKDLDKSDITFVYGQDDRAVYYYDTKDDPPLRYGRALSAMTHPLDNIEDANCPKLKVCVERYIERRVYEQGRLATR